MLVTFAQAPASSRTSEPHWSTDTTTSMGFTGHSGHGEATVELDSELVQPATSTGARIAAITNTSTATERADRPAGGRADVGGRADERDGVERCDGLTR